MRSARAQEISATGLKLEVSDLFIGEHLYRFLLTSYP